MIFIDDGWMNKWFTEASVCLDFADDADGGSGGHSLNACCCSLWILLRLACGLFYIASHVCGTMDKGVTMQ